MSEPEELSDEDWSAFHAVATERTYSHAQYERIKLQYERIEAHSRRIENLLREALEGKYAQHVPWCSRWVLTDQCGCGYHDWRKRAEEAIS